MFNIFKSRRQRLKDEASNMFDNFNAALKGPSAEELAFVLDHAIRIKDASTMYRTKADSLLLYEDPMLVPEERAFDVLNTWKRYMLENAHTLEGRAQVGALSIWYLSLVGCQIAELRYRAREMWEELSRAFPFCEEFDPEVDLVRGVEPSLET